MTTIGPLHCCQPFHSASVEHVCGSAARECCFCFVPQGSGDETTENQPPLCFYACCCWCGPVRSLNQLCVWSVLAVNYGLSKQAPCWPGEFCCCCRLCWDPSCGLCPLPRGGWWF